MRYAPTTSGRLHYLLLVILAAAIPLFVGIAVLERYARGESLQIIEWVFVAPVGLLCLGFAAYCGSRTCARGDRLIITKDSITYRGILRDLQIRWNSVLSIRPIWDRAAGLRWVSICVGDTKTGIQREIKLDLTGLSATNLDFLKHASACAPQATISYISSWH